MLRFHSSPLAPLIPCSPLLTGLVSCCDGEPGAPHHSGPAVSPQHHRAAETSLSFPAHEFRHHHEGGRGALPARDPLLPQVRSLVPGPRFRCTTNCSPHPRVACQVCAAAQWAIDFMLCCFPLGYGVATRTGQRRTTSRRGSSCCPCWRSTAATLTGGISPGGCWTEACFNGPRRAAMTIKVRHLQRLSVIIALLVVLPDDDVFLSVVLRTLLVC